MNQSIFRPLARGRASSPQPCDPTPGVVPPSAPRRTPSASTPPSPSWSTSSDVALIALIEAPVRADETAALGFARKEAELRHVFASLTVLEARVLQSRLSSPKSGDQLAATFQRLTADRRMRLINFLADARRREALRR